jgi:hypothetical protein
MAVLMIACLATEYLPVLHGRLAVAQALYLLQAGEGRQAEARAMDAARADTLSPEPAHADRIAAVPVAGYRRRGDRAAFEDAADAYRRARPPAPPRLVRPRQLVLDGLAEIGEAGRLGAGPVGLHPGQHSLSPAGVLSCTNGVGAPPGGKGRLSQSGGSKAKDLDDQMPHQEQKLRRQKLIDPVLMPTGAKLPRDESAEQTALRLRIISAEKMP